ncbi:MAG TPA: hypothetical protein VNC16_04875 [Solirubrobacterales bacterium]|jgi:hypothetical protein|nr:hypothetical protein [Solirubrobacterales bacterium]
MADLPSWWTDAASPFLFILIGTAVSLYATVVLERSNRFNAILREVNHARRRAELFPSSVSDLEFIRFEDTGKGQLAVFLRPVPQKPTVDSVHVEPVDYF